MKIVFFGASVTAQSVSHSTGTVTGYVDSLSLGYSPSCYIIDRVAYGSSQYSNMGVHGLSNALLKIPNVIFFEWYTTGETCLPKENLQLQHRLLRSLGVEMILLVLPSKRHAKTDTIPKYEDLDTMNIPFLDLRYLLDDESSEPFLRDEVHTNELGAQIYSKCIHSYIQEFVLASAPKPVFTGIHDLISQIDIEYQSVLSREIPLNLHLSANETLSLTASQDSSIIFTLTRGPRTPNVTVHYANSAVTHDITLVDRWSYYDRSSSGMELSLAENREILVTPKAAIPDYSKLCPRLLEQEYSANRVSDPFDLRLSLKSVFVPISSSVTLKRLAFDVASNS
jgi:hypothetical protein